MQPAAHGGDKQGGGLGGSTSMSQKGAVADLIAKPAERVAAHERFFHTYFSRRKEADEKLTKKTKPGAAKRAAEAAEKQSSAAGDDEEEDDEKDDGLGAEGEAFAERLAQSLMRDEPDDDDEGGESAKCWRAPKRRVRLEGPYPYYSSALAWGGWVSG